MASAELLKVTHRIDDGVKGVEGNVQGVRDDVQDVGNTVQGVDDRVQGIGNDVKETGSDVKDLRSDVKDISGDVKHISSEVRGVDDKLDQVNRSLSLQFLLIVPSALIALQGTNSGIVSSDGFRHQIHLLITTLHPKLVTTVQPNGFFKAVYSINGNPPSPSCGYTENVR